jgi:ankyrin repeat protein
LIENGASPNQSLGLGDYLMLSKLKPRSHRVASPVSSNSPQTPVTRPESLFNTKDFPHQAFQKTPLKLEKDYIEDKHIYLFELAALRGHTVIASYLLDQYYRLTRTNSKMVASSQFALLAADDYLWAKQLLRAGVKLTQKDPGGSTPLHLAARRGKLNLVITYVLAGANIHEKGMNGWY